MIRKLCHADHLPREGQLKAFAGTGPAGPVSLCVGLLDGRAYAIDDACPHARASLAGGDLAEGNVACPLHGWQWNLRTGEPVHPGDPCVQIYEVRQYGDEVFVRLPNTPARLPASEKDGR